MSDDFRKAIGELWGRLRLDPPTFGDTDEVTLAIDGLEVSLAESADGRHLVVAGSPGRISSDLHRQGEQVRQLLRTNLGLMQSNKAGLSLDESAAGGGLVRVRASYPYAAARTDDLMKLIEDVLYRMELHVADLAATAPRQAARPQSVAPSLEENVIFRP